MLRKITICAALGVLACGIAAAEGSWQKFILAGPEFSYSRQKTHGFDGGSDKIRTHGLGLNAEFIAADTESGLSFLAKGAGGANYTDDLLDHEELGSYFNIFAGAGFAPIRGERLLLAVTGGIGADYYRFKQSLDGNDVALSGLNFLVGADIALVYRLSERVGIGFNLLGTVSLAGRDSIDYDLNDGSRNDKYEDTENHFVSAGSLSIVPSIGISIQL